MSDEKLVVFTSEDCGACLEMKKKLKDSDVEIVDVTSNEAIEIMKEMKEQDVKFYTIPQCVYKKDGKYHLCDVQKLVEEHE